MGFRGPASFEPSIGIGATGSLAGEGYITTTAFTNAGTVLPGDTGSVGALTFNSNFTQAAGGALAMDLGGGNGAVAGVDYDRIVVTGAQLTVAGMLQLTALPTLSAAPGTVFGLIDNTSSSPIIGEFAGIPRDDVNGTLVTVGGWTFRLRYNGTISGTDNDVTLEVVSTPATSTNTGAVSGTMWDDQNGDGIKGAAEPLAAGVAVDVIDVATGNVVRTFTDSNGAYIVPKLADGDYRVRFDKSTSPTYAGYRFTRTGGDSAADPSTGVAAGPYAIVSGAPVTGVNAGLVNNAAPVGSPVAYTATIDVPLSVTAATGVLASSTDAESDPLTAVLGTGPLHGTVTLNANGSFTYTPTTGFIGIDRFSYYPTDDFGPGEEVWVEVAVASHPPVANDDAASTDEDTPVTVAVLSNDTDPDGDTLTVVGVFGGLLGAAAVNPNGTITYTPGADQNGTDTLTYVIDDGHGQLAYGTVTVTVASKNDAPVFTAGPDIDLPMNSGAQAFAGWATGISAGPPDEAGQALTFHVFTDHPELFTVAPTISADGTLSFTVAANAIGRATVSVALQDDGPGSEDGGGQNASQAQVFYIMIGESEDGSSEDGGGENGGEDGGWE